MIACLACVILDVILCRQAGKPCSLDEALSGESASTVNYLHDIFQMRPVESNFWFPTLKFKRCHYEHTAIIDVDVTGATPLGCSAHWLPRPSAAPPPIGCTTTKLIGCTAAAHRLHRCPSAAAPLS